MTRRIHTIPVDDVQFHFAKETCWCHPTEIRPNIWAHNAKDCREARERNVPDFKGPGWSLVDEYVP